MKDTLSTNKEKIIRDVILNLTIAADYVDDYLAEFPECTGKSMIMKMSKDMYYLSLFIKENQRR